ncbi:MAG: hypothetical protein HC780_22100 [Leptolyngbyaceae cyanobacterium CSU_1_3]|nr:hypothetical protein [Leptolyngbyaceae cyanobacterium CSU_1_3]
MRKTLISIAFLSIFASALPAIAVLPDPETYQFITKNIICCYDRGEMVAPIMPTQPWCKVTKIKES